MEFFLRTWSWWLITPSHWRSRSAWDCCAGVLSRVSTRFSQDYTHRIGRTGRAGKKGGQMWAEHQATWSAMSTNKWIWNLKWYELFSYFTLYSYFLSCSKACIDRYFEQHCHLLTVWEHILHWCSEVLTPVFYFRFKTFTHLITFHLLLLLSLLVSNRVWTCIKSDPGGTATRLNSHNSPWLSQDSVGFS